MTTNLTLDLQEKIKEIMVSLLDMGNEASDLSKLYWSEVSADITGLSDSDPATINSKNTKLELTNGLTIVEQFVNFLGNSAVATGDYLATINSVRYGNDQAPSIISEATENFGDRLVQFCTDLLTVCQKGNIIEDQYNKSEIVLAVAAISSETIVFGADCTKDELTEAITLSQQICRFLGNLSVTTGDYQATVSKWSRL